MWKQPEEREIWGNEKRSLRWTVVLTWIFLLLSVEQSGHGHVSVSPMWWVHSGFYCPGCIAVFSSDSTGPGSGNQGSPRAAPWHVCHESGCAQRNRAGRGRGRVTKVRGPWLWPFSWLLCESVRWNFFLSVSLFPSMLEFILGVFNPQVHLLKYIQL